MNRTSGAQLFSPLWNFQQKNISYKGSLPSTEEHINKILGFVLYYPLYNTADKFLEKMRCPLYINNNSINTMFKLRNAKNLYKIGECLFKISQKMKCSKNFCPAEPIASILISSLPY